MKRKKTTAAELPEEVLRNEILTRLPIKSVVRFKCVAKSWLSLFSDPQFVREHHTRSPIQNPNDYDCLVVNKRTRIVILSRYKETILLPSDLNYFLIGSVNGLICLYRNRKFSLWNPAIHQSKEFTFPPRCSRTYEYDFGLGFDRVTDNFKVVVLSADFRSATVYCSGSDSWSIVFIHDIVFPKNIGFRRSTPTVIVNGCPYWTCSTYTYDRHRQFISLTAVKFNVETNEFKLSPEFHFNASVHGGGNNIHYKFVDMKDCLTLMVYDQNSSNCVLDIYSLDGEEGFGFWSKMYTIGPLNFHTIGSYVSLSQGFKYGGEIVFYNHGMFSCYNHETDTIKRLRGMTSTPYAVSCFPYAPTLFYIQGMKSVHLTTQSRAPGCYRTPRRLITSLRD